jgi:anthranilate/para-aminobenzoate synthase component I
MDNKKEVAEYTTIIDMKRNNLSKVANQCAWNVIII